MPNGMGEYIPVRQIDIGKILISKWENISVYVKACNSKAEIWYLQIGIYLLVNLS